MGQLVKGGLLRPLDAYAEATSGATATRRRCSTSTASPTTASEFGSGEPLRPLADGRDRRRLLQQGQGVLRRRRRSRSSRRQLKQAKSDGDVPIPFGNLDAVRRASTSSRRCRTSTPTSRRSATSCSRKDGASFDTPENQEAADEAPGLGEGGLLHARLQRHGLRPRLAAVRQGQGPVPDRGHVADRRPRRQHGRQGRVHAHAAGRGGRRPGLARRREPAVRGHSKSEEPRRRGRLHRLPHQRGGRRRCSSTRTTCRRCRPTRRRRRRVGRRRQGVEDAQRGRRLRPVHRLRRRRRSTTTSRRRCRSCWAGSRIPAAFTRAWRRTTRSSRGRSSGSSGHDRSLLAARTAAARGWASGRPASPGGSRTSTSCRGSRSSWRSCCCR